MIKKLILVFFIFALNIIPVNSNDIIPLLNNSNNITPIDIEISRVSFYTLNNSNNIMEVKISLISKNDNIIINTFPNKCHYEISFNSFKKNFLSPPVKMRRATMKSDLIKLNKNEIYKTSFKRYDLCNINLPDDKIKYIEVFLTANININKKWKRFQLTSKKFYLFGKKN